MARETKYIDLRDLGESAAWRRVLDDVCSGKRRTIIRVDGEDVAEIRSVGRKQSSRRLMGKPTTADDPLWKIIGIAHEEQATDVSESHDKYLADAYVDTHE